MSSIDKFRITGTPTFAAENENDVEEVKTPHITTGNENNYAPFKYSPESVELMRTVIETALTTNTEVPYDSENYSSPFEKMTKEELIAYFEGSTSVEWKALPNHFNALLKRLKEI
ncbi:hypothetical protein KKH15_02695 [Patescibacteria group bacterium]|nr:hypothetical protein [Patescibacteria group bacterium]MBU1755089.1 hypothetical protein [Patescibacteria group bacterium]